MTAFDPKRTSNTLKSGRSTAIITKLVVTSVSQATGVGPELR